MYRKLFLCTSLLPPGQVVTASGRLPRLQSRPRCRFFRTEPNRHPMMKKVSVDNFSSDPMFPRMERVIAEQLAKGNVVMPCKRHR